MRISIVILAAGKGTRMRSNTPKVLHKIADVAMLDYVLDTAENLSPIQVLTVTGHASEAIEAHLSGRSVAVKQEPQEGTGHALKVAYESIDDSVDNVLVLYGDTPFISEGTLTELLSLKADVAVLGFEPMDPAKYGRLVTDGEALNAIVEFKDATEEEKAIGLCNSGVMAISYKKLKGYLDQLSNKNAAKEYYLTDLVALANEAGDNVAYAVGDEQEVMGINSRSELAIAEAMMQGYLCEKAMDQGVTMLGPETVFLGHHVTFGEDVMIEPSVMITGEVHIESGAHIKAFTRIEGPATIKEGAIIGPYARVRPETEIGKNARIGNFVEIKKSTLADGVKAGHLSYIGDSTIGEEANIGAGAITCNYDGEKKHQTHIGSGAFIGSGTSLVAPVKVGANAVTGANSTIREDVPESSVAYDQKPQQTKKKL